VVDGVGGKVGRTLGREKRPHRLNRVGCVERGDFAASGGLHMGFDLKKTVY